MLKFILFLMLLPISSWACETKNHIFLIHGIGGGKSTFGSMEEYLNKYDSCFVTSTFIYDTGNSFLSTYDFANSFHSFVTDRVKSGVINVNDKISLVMHSQGGIVGTIWLNMIRQTDMGLFSQIDSFITLSTPHWGADMANLGKKILFTLPESWDNPIAPMGRIELNEMSYGSATIRDISWSLPDIFAHKFIRPLAIAGHHKGGPSLIAESDIVVPIYSSRADHYRAESNIHPEDSFTAIPFTKHETTPFTTVPADHILMELTVPGVVDLPKKCLKSECTHPSIKPITDHLKGRAVASVLPELKNFRISLYLKNFPKDVSVKLLDSDDDFKKAPAKIANDLAFTYEGKSSRKGAQKFLLSLKSKQRTQVVEVTAEAGYASVVNLNLAE